MKKIFNLLDIYCVSIIDEDSNMELYVKKRNQKTLVTQLNKDFSQ